MRINQLQLIKNICEFEINIEDHTTILENIEDASNLWSEFHIDNLFLTLKSITNNSIQYDYGCELKQDNRQFDITISYYPALSSFTDVTMSNLIGNNYINFKFNDFNAAVEFVNINWIK